MSGKIYVLNWDSIASISLKNEESKPALKKKTLTVSVAAKNNICAVTKSQNFKKYCHCKVEVPQHVRLPRWN